MDTRTQDGTMSGNSKRAVHTDAAPAPVAAYSQAVRKGGFVQVAGQVGVDPATGAAAEGDLAAQTRQVFENLRAVLKAAEAGFGDVVMLRVYLTDTAHFAEFNAVYNELVAEPYPARTTVYVGLPPGLLVEIDALAVLD